MRRLFDLAHRGTEDIKRNRVRRPTDWQNRVDRIAPFSDASGTARDVAYAGEDEENSQMSKSLRVFAACAVLAGLAACAAPPPPAPVVTAPPPKPLDAKTQLENHM
jgi:hypothetical protein